MPQNNEKDTLMQSLSEDTSSVFADLIKEKVESLLGSGNQLFTMDFPARPSNPDSQDGDNVADVLSMAYNICKNDADPVTKFEMTVEGVLKVRNGEIAEFTGADKQLYSLLEECSTEALYSMKEYFNQIYELNLAVEEAVNAQLEFVVAQTQKVKLLKEKILSQMDEVQEEINSLASRVSAALSESAR